MRLAIGHGDDAGQTGARDVGKSAVDGGKQCGAVMAAFRHLDSAPFEVAEVGGLLLQLGAGGIDRSGAVGGVHGRGAVEHEKGDVRHGVAGFADEPGAAEPGKQDGEGDQAPKPAASAAEQGGEHGSQADRRKQGHRPPGDSRVEAQGGDGLFKSHWPSRSRMAGTWTWSPL